MAAVAAAAVCAAGYGGWVDAGQVSIPGDGDPYVRFVRVLELLRTGDWLSNAIPASHLGEAEDVRWSRPLDLLILACAWPLRAALPDREAVLLAGSLISPALWVASVPLVVWALRPFGLGAYGTLCGVLAFVLNPLILSEFGFGRGDHHALLLVGEIVFLGSFFRALEQPERLAPAFASGAFAGLGIWVHPELTLFPAIACAFLGGLFVRGEPGAARALGALGLGACLTTAAASAIEHGLSAWWWVEHERVSGVHVSLFAAVFGCGLALEACDGILEGRGRVARALAACVVAGSALALLALAFPAFYRGPLLGMDPALADVWFRRLKQSRPLWPIRSAGDAQYAALVAGQLAVALVAGVWLWRAIASADRRRAELVGLATVTVAALAVGFRRPLLFLPALVCVPLALAGDRVWRRWPPLPSGTGSRPERLARVFGIEGYAAGCALTAHVLLGLGGALGPEASGASASLAECRRELSRVIQQDHPRDRSGLDRALIATPSDNAPELLFWTEHRVLAWNHHRSAEGLTRLDRLFRARTDGELDSVLRAPDVDLVLYCPRAVGAGGYFTKRDPAPLPAWMRVVDGQRDGDRPVLVRVDR